MYVSVNLHTYTYVRTYVAMYLCLHNVQHTYYKSRVSKYKVTM